MNLSINTNLVASNASRHLGMHYSDLATSVGRLSSGLRINSAADDAAGLAIRELMRADITAMNQGVRNVSDAISLIQTADGALGIIDEKLIRMKELAEQASTGTYSSDQRLLIDSEFQAMAAEIDRIANATEFNGVKLLNGNLQGQHNGAGLTSTGELKVHFGSGNDSAQDYYYIGIGDATLSGLGLSTAGGTVQSDTALRVNELKSLWEWIPNGGDPVVFGDMSSTGIGMFTIIPKGTTNLSVHMDDNRGNDSFQLFTLSGKHIVGTAVGSDDWNGAGISSGSDVIRQGLGFNRGAAYDGSGLNGTGGNLPFTQGVAGNMIDYNGMTIGYSGDGNPGATDDRLLWQEYLTLDEAKEDLVLMTVGWGALILDGSWDFMPYYSEPEATGGSNISIPTQELAQQTLGKIDEAILRKDKIRAHLGATQNRLENTISNLQIQVENLQAAESRISDVDVADEMTEFVRKQILTQSAVSMLAQANSMPQTLLSLVA